LDTTVTSVLIIFANLFVLAQDLLERTTLRLSDDVNGCSMLSRRSRKGSSGAPLALVVPLARSVLQRAAHFC
jgi:ABC-type Na+ transport system ATPase subunit NatA